VNGQMAAATCGSLGYDTIRDTIRYDAIVEFNVDSKAEYTAKSYNHYLLDSLLSAVSMVGYPSDSLASCLLIAQKHSSLQLFRIQKIVQDHLQSCTSTLCGIRLIGRRCTFRIIAMLMYFDKTRVLIFRIRIKTSG